MSLNLHDEDGVRQFPTIEEMEKDNMRRFCSLNKYVIEKMRLDPFVIAGNKGIADGLRNYIQCKIQTFQNYSTIKVMDIGPAHGAITSLFMLCILEEYNLFEKVELYLVDPVIEVLLDTKNINFALHEIMTTVYYLTQLYSNKENQWSLEKFIQKITNLLKSSKTQIINERAINISLCENFIDICGSAFSFHHIHPDEKNASAEAILRCIKPAGFLGFADEYFMNYEQDFILTKHNFTIDEKDVIPIEAPVSLEDFIALFHNKLSITSAFYDGKSFFNLIAKKRVHFEKEYWIPKHIK